MCITQLLLECDSAEVRRIVQTAQLVMDKVAFVEGVQSMHALVVCFKVRVGIVC